MKRKPRRPTLSPQALEVWKKIDEYVRTWAKRRRPGAVPLLLDNAASDVMDGWKLRGDDEVKELVRKKLIGWVGTSWYLTDKGKTLLDPRKPTPDGKAAVAKARVDGAIDAERYAWV